ncbi:MAG: exodeoxyribonuclease V subunit gamma, partial [Clostridia bacterium]|nr:exodeoxyribonuclease V subunit gamma [Clostridia bacterium]
MLKLIYGSSGSGKTSALIEAIRADIQNGIQCFLLVPEQQAYISERDLPKALPNHAGRFFEVVHFSGLAEDVFREYGGVTQGSINPALKTLLMWDTLRTISPLLTQYGKSSSKDATLSSLILQAIEELHINGIDAQTLEDAAKELPAESTLSKKLCDLALIDAVFREKIETAFGTDPADKFIRMAELLREHRYFENCRMYIDSFTSFTAQEYAVLREILKQADGVTISLCTDDLHSELPHFESVTETGKRLCKMASGLGIRTEKVQLSIRAAAKPRALSVLERDLWRFDLPRHAKERLSEQETDAVRLLSCPNLYEEAEAAALYILEQIQSGMRYGDIAIVVRDVETYRGVLDAAMERYGIPYFLSESVNLSSKPLTRLILSALRAVSRRFYAQDVITLIKTGLAGIDVADAALFEEYCETWHLSGSRFTDALWSMNPDGLTTERSPRADVILETANRVRKTVMDPLLKLDAAMRASARLEDRCRAVYDYLSDLQVSEQLSARAKQELLADRRRDAGETVRLYRFVMETLLSLCKLLPDSELTMEELIAALTLLFSETELSSVPNLHDCVIIGSAATLRVENVKASLLLGLCEGEFPQSINDNGILTEGDKETLEEIGVLLDSRASRRSTEELLYVYRAITKPSQQLYLSTVQAQIDGSLRTPS